MSSASCLIPVGSAFLKVRAAYSKLRLSHICVLDLGTTSDKVLAKLSRQIFLLNRIFIFNHIAKSKQFVLKESHMHVQLTMHVGGQLVSTMFHPQCTVRRNKNQQF